MKGEYLELCRLPYGNYFLRLFTFELGFLRSAMRLVRAPPQVAFVSLERHALVQKVRVRKLNPSVVPRARLFNRNTDTRVLKQDKNKAREKTFQGWDKCRKRT